ncbi:hypothetical protein GALMADRAFT_1087002 [Galerina marginata CBS 339.88]|uniref:Uncharacterized protein n=1 Tax=Galerina marginata (strain CBS 339.88) TaxID=685588 RepID=A0A067SBZ6_GALM3|nr:hypothetical protein GALMADRAFT_1087002 [Galerina marginata CBS 339.88]
MTYAYEEGCRCSRCAQPYTMPQLLITEAHLVEFFVASITYGMHVVSAGCCIRVLISPGGEWKKADTINWAMLSVCAFLLANGTFNVAIQFNEAVKAFIFSTGAGGPTAMYTTTSALENIAKPLSIYVQTLIGDAVLIYRCWIIYYCSWPVVFLPIILWITTLGAGIWTVFLEANLRAGAINQAEVWPARATFWSVTTSISLITTSLLVWRIWRVERDNHRNHVGSGSMHTGYLRDVIGIIVESGLLYSAVAFITGVTNAVRNNSMFIVSSAEMQIVGIAFNLIIIRLGRLSGQGISRDSQYSYPSSGSLEFKARTAITTGDSPTYQQRIGNRDHQIKTEVEISVEYSSDQLSDVELKS